MLTATKINLLLEAPVVYNLSMCLETEHDIRLSDNGPVTDTMMPVVLLHGLGNSLNFWTDVAPAVAEKTRTLALDLPGFGESAAADDQSLDGVTAKIAELLSDRSVSGACVVAHSMSAYVALRLAAKHPDRVSRVVLVSGALLRADEMLRNPLSGLRNPALLGSLAAQFIGATIPLSEKSSKSIFSSAVARRALLWPYVAHPGELNSTSLSTALAGNGGLAALRTLAIARTSPRLEQLLAATDQDVWLIRGEHDHLVSSVDVDMAKAIRPIAEDFVVRECGHWPMLEQPQGVTALIELAAARP
jgi:pimeloyl-ACP methyl ester carboxylesterase